MVKRSLVAVDIGNTLIKCGFFELGALRDVVVLPHGGSHLWQEKLAHWHASTLACPWLAGCVNYKVGAEFGKWVARHLDRKLYFAQADSIPIRVSVEHPQEVGIDRLLNGVAAKQLRGPGRPAIVIDCGSAVTVDMISAHGEFLGGAILPGLRLCVQALHNYTEKLPLVDIAQRTKMPGKNTEQAIQAGLLYGLAGAVSRLVDEAKKRFRKEPEVFLTGGDAVFLKRNLPLHVCLKPYLTLQGLWFSAARVLDSDA